MLIDSLLHRKGNYICFRNLCQKTQWDTLRIWWSLKVTLRITSKNPIHIECIVSKHLLHTYMYMFCRHFFETFNYSIFIIDNNSHYHDSWFYVMIYILYPYFHTFWYFYSTKNQHSIHHFHQSCNRVNSLTKCYLKKVNMYPNNF